MDFHSFSSYDPTTIPEDIFNLDDVNNCVRTDSYAIPILISLIAAVGLLANSVVIFIITVLREYTKSVTNIYVLQLAIADSIFLMQLPFHARSMVTGQWSYGAAWCKISESVKMLNYYTSIMFLTIMSVDRYLAICFAMNQKVMKFRGKRAAFLISSSLWILGLLSVINIMKYADVKQCLCEIFFPFSESQWNLDEYMNISGSGYADDEYGPYDYGKIFNSSKLEGLMKDDTVCSFAHTSKYFQTWLLCNFLLAFLAPLLIICVVYGLIIKRILKPMVVGSRTPKSNRTRKRVTIMVTALVTAFIACWLPYHTFNLARINDLRLLAQPCKTITNITIILAYSNSAINPFFYTFLGTNFHRRWKLAVGKAGKNIRQSILSHSAEYTPGQSGKIRRQSSAADSMKKRDDLSSSSFATKHSVIPMNNQIIKEERV